MSVWRNLLYQQDELTSLLEASALQARASVQSLIALSKAPNDSPAEHELAYSRLKDSRITEEISKQVYTTFITSLDRLDIERLSNALYKIPKIAQKFGERLRSCPELGHSTDFSVQLSLLDRAAGLLVQLVRCLQQGMDLEQIKMLNDDLQATEAEADKEILMRYRQLYNSQYPALQVVVLKDLYELLEKLVDRCRDAGNLIASIALKNA